MRLIALATTFFLLGSNLAAAGGVDLKVGSHPGYFCGYQVRYDIETQEPGRWVFHGKIWIRATGEYDPLWIEQYSNNSLRVIRYLQGANLGLTQVVQTNPPYETMRAPGAAVITIFETRDGGNGFGCARDTHSVIYMD